MQQIGRVCSGGRRREQAAVVALLDIRPWAVLPATNSAEQPGCGANPPAGPDAEPPVERAQATEALAQDGADRREHRRSCYFA